MHERGGFVICPGLRNKIQPMPGNAKRFENYDYDDDGVDDYDYEQHMLTDAKAKEILAFGSGSLQTFVVVPKDFNEFEQDAYFTGELEKDPARLNPEERELCLKLKDCDSLSSGSVTDVEDMIDCIVSAERIPPMRRSCKDQATDGDSIEGEYSTLAKDMSSPDVVDAALVSYIEKDLDDALREMEPDDFDDVNDGHIDYEEVNAVNEYAKVFNAAAKISRVKQCPFGAEENRKFIEHAVTRQLEEESVDSSESVASSEPESLSNSVEAGDTSTQENVNSDSDYEPTAKVFHYDKTLLVNMASSESVRQTQRPIMNITEAKHLDVAQLMF